MLSILDRKRSNKFVKYSVILLGIIVFFFYYFLTERLSIVFPKQIALQSFDSSQQYFPQDTSSSDHAGIKSDQKSSQWEECYQILERDTDITTIDEYSKFDFAPSWVAKAEFWDDKMEERLLNSTNKLPAKVILIPHSHNDPGWLKTFTDYFREDSKFVINNMIEHMTRDYKDLTFIWSEISFLDLWWNEATLKHKKMFKDLVVAGRLEITTGGWVMTDEANVHLYAMLDQLIEGHQWVKINLNVTPTVGWSIDPFGHGSTVPYLLSSSGFEAAIIQRINFAWKQWFAAQQKGDFEWMPYWQEFDKGDKPKSMLTHDMLFQGYSITYSCGPHSEVCSQFDFRKIPGDYFDPYQVNTVPITDENVAAKAKLLVEQYSMAASLFTHNVALVPLGDDFRFNKEPEVQQQYTNYKKLIDYINKNKNQFGDIEIGFGTPKDYFTAIKKRSNKQFPTLKGDFFVYADINREPAYWSGYYSTRPMYKIMSRQLEASLRSAEILYTLTLNLARQANKQDMVQHLTKYYENLVTARRNLALFQHHDAITGTSKPFVMTDYGRRMFEGIKDTINIQERAIEYLLQDSSNEPIFVDSILDQKEFTDLPKMTPLLVTPTKTALFAVYNSLGQDRFEVISIRVTTTGVNILDQNGDAVNIQVNPVWVKGDKISASNTEFEVIFVYKLPALSITTFTVVHSTKRESVTVYCDDCNHSEGHFNVKLLPFEDDIKIENSKIKILFDRVSGFMESVTIANGTKMKTALNIGAYFSVSQHSGAYLFKPMGEFGILLNFRHLKQLLISIGPIMSEVSVVYGPLLTHSVRIFNTRTILDDAIYIENYLDQSLNDGSEKESFMRFNTDIENGELPEFYTDQNGFQYMQRKLVPQIGIEGNYYPITQTAFMQDKKTRFTLLTTHAQGAASLEQGQLEVMLDRRTRFDDGRGLGEGVQDNRVTHQKFWLILEKLEIDQGAKGEYQMPSIYATTLANSLNYPVHLYSLKSKKDHSLKLQSDIKLIPEPLPCDLHLLNLRTLSDPRNSKVPSESALMIFHRFGYNCNRFQKKDGICSSTEVHFFNDLKTDFLFETSLTGLQEIKQLKNIFELKIAPLDLKTIKIKFSSF